MENAPETCVSEAAVIDTALEGPNDTARPVVPQERFLDPAYRLDDLAALALTVTHSATYNPTHRDWLDGLGLTEARRRRRAGVLARGGHRLIAVPVYCPWSYEAPALVDVVTFDPTTAGTFSTLTGRAVVLAEPGALAFPMGTTIRLHSDLLAWCRAGGDGLFVCNWRAARDLLVGRDIRLVVDNVAAGDAVERAIARDNRPPAILVGRAA